MTPPARSITVCDVCNVVLARGGALVENRPSTMCSHLRGTTWEMPFTVERIAEALDEAQREARYSGGGIAPFDQRVWASFWDRLTEGDPIPERPANES